jgi:hypothetical protein
MIRAAILLIAVGTFVGGTATANAQQSPVHLDPQMMGCNSNGGLTWIATGTAPVEHKPPHGQDSSITFSSHGTNLDHVRVSILWGAARPVTVDPIVSQPNEDIITVHFDGITIPGTEGASDTYEPQVVSYIILMTNKANGCKVTR